MIWHLKNFPNEISYFLTFEGNENISPQTYENMIFYQYNLFPLLMNMFLLQWRFLVSLGIKFLFQCGNAIYESLWERPALLSLP